MQREAQLNVRATKKTLELLRLICRRYEMDFRLQQVSQADALERIIDMEAERLGIGLKDGKDNGHSRRSAR